MNQTNSATISVSAAIVLIANYVLNLCGIQPMPPDVTLAAGVVVHTIGIAAMNLFKWYTASASPAQS